MTISDVTSQAILNLVYSATTWANYAINASASPETNIVVQLHTADPGDAGTGSTSEAAYTSYARVNVARSTGWSASTTTTGAATVSPAATISFPAGTGGSGTVTHFSTGKSGGGASALLWSGTVTPNIVTGNGVTPQLTTATTIGLT
jgi:hypothetical protein